MPVSPERLDALLGLGDKIAEAIETEEWSRLSGLLERRARIAQNLETGGLDGDEDPADADALSADELSDKIDALTEQHNHLTALLRNRRDQIESELDQIRQIRRAQDSYSEQGPDAKGPTRSGALPPGLSG